MAERILVVEDDPTVRRILERALALAGYEVVAAGSQREGEALCAERLPEVILADYTLPDGTGVDLAAHCRERDPAVAVVLMSGYPLHHIGDARLPEGTAFLPKPFLQGQLFRAIDSARGAAKRRTA